MLGTVLGVGRLHKQNRSCALVDLALFCRTLSVGFDLIGYSHVRLVLVAGHGASQHWMVLVAPKRWCGLGLAASVSRVSGMCPGLWWALGCVGVGQFKGECEDNPASQEHVGPQEMIVKSLTG